MRNVIALLVLAVSTVGPGYAQESIPVKITVDAAKQAGPLNPIWKWCGYDEPNYTYAPNGKRLVNQFTEAARAFGPAYFRTHSLLCTGDGTGGVKWGATNAYTEDASGKPIYDWTLVDRIFDTYLNAGAKPYAQIGFMPKALSQRPEPYEHHWKPGDPYNDIYTGWTTPPNDYDKWRELVFQWAKHAVEKYGKAEVESWHWEVWNEPNIGYLKGSKVEDYMKIYDYAADGLKRALPTAQIGGAETAGPGGAFQRQFIEHCLEGTNYATGKKGSPLDSISFHAKGSPQLVQRPTRHVRMGIMNQLRNINDGFGIVAARPETKKLPVIIGESDPDGCAACPGAEPLYPQNGYRNGTLYAVYTIEQLARTLELADRHGVNLAGAVTWAFEFENQPIFGGFRQLSTDGIELPVLNSFRMLGKMGHTRIPATSDGDVGLDAMLRGGVRGERPDVSSLASRDDRRITIITWNYHDDDLPGPAANVSLEVDGLPAELATAKVSEWRIDETHSNAFIAWKKMGSPAKPTADQRKELEQQAKLAAAGPVAETPVRGGKAMLTLSLPRQAVSMVEITW
jgi:xylan 1,4-beta-xylosidase